MQSRFFFVDTVSSCHYLANTKMNILIVDDDPLYIELVRDVIAQFGHATIAAENGERALEHLRAREVHLIISDIEMPVMGGIAFYGRVRELAQHQRTPFVFLSGTTRGDLLEAVSELPDARHIQKAQLVAELPALLEDLGRRKQSSGKPPDDKLSEEDFSNH